MNDFLSFLWALMTFDFIKSNRRGLDANEVHAAWAMGVDDVVSSQRYPCHWCEDEVYRHVGLPIVWLHASTGKATGNSPWLDSPHQALAILAVDLLEDFREKDA